jgi:hypothetical protein
MKPSSTQRARIRGYARRSKRFGLIGRVLGRPRRSRPDRRMLVGSLLLALTVAVVVLPEALLEPPSIALEETHSGDAPPPPIHAFLRPGPIGLPSFEPGAAARSGGARPVITPRAAELRAVGQPRGQPPTGSPSRTESTGIPP